MNDRGSSHIRSGAKLLGVTMVAVAAIACGTSDTDTGPRHDDDYGTVIPGVPDRGSAESVFLLAIALLFAPIVTRAQAIPRTDGRAVGTAVVIQTVMHRDGGTTPYRTFSATAELRHEDGKWKLATYPTTT